MSSDHLDSSVSQGIEPGKPVYSKAYLLKADALLAILFICISATILFRVQVNNTGYLSPDSVAYLGLAQSLKDGYGLYILDGSGTGRQYFSTWPIGYPILIYLFSELTTLDVYWSSKLLNLLFLGLGFLLFRHLNRPYSFLLASIYGAYTFMEVYSFTWSEAPFLLGLLFLAYITNQVYLKGNNTHIILLFLTCIALFLLRYIGAFSFAVPALLGLYFIYKHNYRTVSKLLFATLLLAIFAAAYLYINYTYSGFITGGERFAGEAKGPGNFILMLFKGLLNELLIIKKFRAGNQPDFLLYITGLLQFILMYWIIKAIRPFPSWQEVKYNSFALSCLVISFLYLISLVTLRTISYFDELDYSTLR